MDDLRSNGFIVHESFHDAGRQEPATLKYANATGTESFASDFSVAYAPKQRYAIGEAGENFFSYQALLEGSFHANDEKQNSSLKFHAADLASDVSLSNTEQRLASLHLRGGPDYEASQDFRTQDIFAQICGTPTYAPTYMGIYSHEISPAALQMRWQPDLEFDAGAHVKREGAQSSVEPHDAIARTIPGASASIRSIKLAREVGMQEVNLTVGDKMAFLPMEGRSYNHVQTSLNFVLVPGFTFSALYRDGRAAPTYQADNFVGVRFAIQVDPTKRAGISR